MKGYWPRLEEAISFAAKTHQGQVYRGYNGRRDEPYILHLIRVMMDVPLEAKVIAILHDAWEDFEELPDWLSEVDREAVMLLSRPSGMPYEEYIDRLVTAPGETGELARTVKAADLRDNLSHDPPHSLRRRYEAALTNLGYLMEV